MKQFNKRYVNSLVGVLFVILSCQMSYGQSITPSFALKIAQYKYLDDFHNGFARVCKSGDHIGEWGIIDKTGNEIVECIYDEVGRFNDDLAYVRDHDGKYGYVDNMGELVIPCKYHRAQDFSEGLAWVNDNGPWCCIDRDGKVIFILDIMSKYRSNFKGGFSIITPPEGEGESSIINTKGQTINMKGRSWLGNGVSDGLILSVVGNGDDEEPSYEYIDTEGNVVIDCTNFDGYFDFRPFFNGLAPVVDMENMKVGYIDKTGKFAIPPTLPFYAITNVDEDPYCCYDGMIRTVKNFGDEDSIDFDLKYGFIDSTGKLVIPYMYKGAYDFSGGLAAVCKEDGKWGFINKKGDVAIPFKYDGVSYDSFQDGFALVVIGDKLGYVDKNGNDTFSVK